ncbi:alpha/beta hydrolase [Pseudodesulfovibrio cashew]|uniref:Alpha/beta hydrolase n=2 Tax=Pseudodesulfovibrio cashew TaxID=2678688 RepID=A0A6I6JP66_9BACT|nr:alpha/beta hydrolase [Pseudodesulfovibrio cashew]
MLCLPGMARASEDGKAFDAHATAFHYFFQDGDMDFHFGNLVLGAVGNGGGEVGEIFYAASKIKDGDADSWHREWFELSTRVEARGDKALAGGHKLSARTQYLRAAYYARISLIAMLPDNPELAKRAERTRTLMQKACPLFDPPLEYIEIPFEDTVLPGYFRPALSDGKPAPTLLMIGGGETFAEDLYFYIAQEAFERGYNFMTVDLPGQGMLPQSGHIFRTDTYVPMKAVVDLLLKRCEVDSARLAAFGYSGGGLFVPQAAMHDPRLKAIIMSAAVIDAEALFATMPAATDTAKDKQSWTSFHANVVRSICWRYGVDPDNPSELINANAGNTFDPARIGAPALILLGEGEYKSAEARRQVDIAIKGFPNPKSRLVVTPSNEGASNHCLMENRRLVGLEVFDWLDEVFK